MSSPLPIFDGAGEDTEGRAQPRLRDDGEDAGRAIRLGDLTPVVVGRHQGAQLVGLEPVPVAVLDRRLDLPGDRPLEVGVLLECGDDHRDVVLAHREVVQRFPVHVHHERVASAAHHLALGGLRPVGDPVGDAHLPVERRAIGHTDRLVPDHGDRDPGVVRCRHRLQHEHAAGRVHVVRQRRDEHVAAGRKQRHVTHRDGREVAPAGLDDVSKFPDLVAELLDRGVSDEDAAKVVGGNSKLPPPPSPPSPSSLLNPLYIYVCECGSSLITPRWQSCESGRTWRTSLLSCRQRVSQSWKMTCLACGKAMLGGNILVAGNRTLVRNSRATVGLGEQVSGSLGSIDV